MEEVHVEMAGMTNPEGSVKGEPSLSQRVRRRWISCGRSVFAKCSRPPASQHQDSINTTPNRKCYGHTGASLC